MNDTPSTSSTALNEPVNAPHTGGGQLLRQYRETAGLHIVALSSALKVARAKLEALEADRYADLPDVVFARALAMSCCRYLGKDPEPVLALMPGHAAQPTPSLRQHLPAQQEATSRPRFTPSRGPFGNTAVPSWLVWVFVLMVIVVGGWFAASPQRPVVKPPASALDFPPQGVPGAEPVPVTQDAVAAGVAASQVPAQGASAAPAAVATPASPAVPAPGSLTITPVPTPASAPAPTTPSATAPVRVEPVTPARH
jgi:cytoskeleton protein RodZ